jgi:hypothetical protein
MVNGLFSGVSRPLIIIRSLIVAHSVRSFFSCILPKNLLAHCHLGLSRLYKQSAKRDKVQEHLTVAITMFRRMSMRFWLEKAEAEMKELPERE